MKNGFVELKEKLIEFFVKSGAIVMLWFGYKPDIPPDSYRNWPNSGWAD